MASQELQLGSVKGKNIKVSDKFPSGMEAKVLEKKQRQSRAWKTSRSRGHDFREEGSLRSGHLSRCLPGWRKIINSRNRISFRGTRMEPVNVLLCTSIAI